MVLAQTQGSIILGDSIVRIIKLQDNQKGGFFKLGIHSFFRGFFLNLNEKIKDLESKITAFRIIAAITQLTNEQSNIANILVDHLNSLHELTKKNLKEEKEPESDDAETMDSVPSTQDETLAKHKIAERIE